MQKRKLTGSNADWAAVHFAKKQVKVAYWSLYIALLALVLSAVAIIKSW